MFSDSCLFFVLFLCPGLFSATPSVAVFLCPHPASFPLAAPGLAAQPPGFLLLQNPSV